MSENIKEGVAYLHMIAQGLPDEVAWSAAWTDRAYHHLVKNRMGGAEAYAQAVSMFAVNSRDLDQTSPEEVIFLFCKKASRRRKSSQLIRPTRGFACSSVSPGGAGQAVLTPHRRGRDCRGNSAGRFILRQAA